MFENEHYAVVNKPAGMVTHPSHGHLDDSLLTSLSENTLHPVMRLDRETSGLLIVAKDGYSHNMLATTDIKKRYKALCYGRFEPMDGTMDFPIARRPDSVMIRDCVPDGKPSVTHYKTLAMLKKNDNKKHLPGPLFFMILLYVSVFLELRKLSARQGTQIP